MMASQWLIWRNDKKAGPVSAEKIKQLAAAGKLLPTDYVQKEGEDKRYLAGTVKGLIPESTNLRPPGPAPAGPSIEPDETNAPETTATPSTSRAPANQVAVGDQAEGVAGKRDGGAGTIPWSRIGLGTAAASIILGITVVVVARSGNRPVTDPAGVVRAAVPASVTPDADPVPGTPNAGPARPSAATLTAEAVREPSSAVARRSVVASAATLTAEAVREGLELPPVGPTRAPAVDRVAIEYKTARAAYQDARKKARGEIRVQFLKRRGELGKGRPDPGDKASLDYNEQLKAFAYGAGKSQDTGPLPTHPVMASAVADYWQTLETAAREFGEVADRGLAAYEKAGVTDPAKLRPLQAASLAGKHADLLGIWSSGGGKVEHDVWVVDVDEATGGWRVDGSMNYKKGNTGRLYHAEKIKFEQGGLSFEASLVDTARKTTRGAATAVSLKLKDGNLRYTAKVGRGKSAPQILARTGEESVRSTIEYWGVPKATPAEPGGATEKPEPADPNYAWRRIAVLSSFPAYRGKSGLAGGEQFFLPYRSKHPTLTPGPYGGLTDMLLGRAPGGGKNQRYAELLFREFEAIDGSRHPYLKRAAGEFLALCRARFQLAEADELLGNTPNSSIRQFQQNVLLPAAKYVFQREADRAELQDRIDRALPDERIVVIDAPMSAASREHLTSLLKGAGGMMDDVKQRARVSGLLSYADMAQVDRASTLWQTWLLPLAKKCGGPPSSARLVAVEGDWSLPLAKDRVAFNALKEFRLKNVSGQDLTQAVVELVAENEWGDKASQYYYFSRLDVAEVARLLPHPRWERRRLPFTNTVKLTWSVWADQGSELDRRAELTNPMPNPDPAGWRKNYLDNDLIYQAEGEALGAIVRNFTFLPIEPERQRRRLMMLAAAASTYAVQLSDKEEPLIVRFLRLDEDKATVELEVVNLVGGKPHRPDMPVWRGSLKTDKEAGFVIRLDAGWTIQLGNDDQPSVSVPKGDDSPPKLVPLVRVKLP